jgi:hypothetical protein
VTIRKNAGNQGELDSLMEWVANGNSVNRNPLYAYGDDGKQLDYTSAYRHCAKEYKKELRRDLGEYERAIADLTDEERTSLHLWVANGNSVYENPYHMTDDSYRPIGYIKAIRITEELWGNSEHYCDECRNCGGEG